MGGLIVLGQIGEAERDTRAAPGPVFQNFTMLIGCCPAKDASASSSRESTWPETSWFLATAETVIWESPSNPAPASFRAARSALSKSWYAGVREVRSRAR